VSGLHGDAPRIVVAPTSIADCLTATQWSVCLAEALQVPAIVLSDQFMGQSRAVIDRPADLDLHARRLTAAANAADYKRYRNTEDGISPMAVPGTPGVVYTADGLEHSEGGIPSSQSRDHRLQLDKRERKLAGFDFGERWADVGGDVGADAAVITFGSTSAAVDEAVRRVARDGVAVKTIVLRLLAPARPERFAALLRGVARVLVVEQNHGAQLYRYLRSVYDLPPRSASFHHPGPLPLRPGEIAEAIRAWRSA
jgi:2-oxoglutarate ferredoxin oxidoreductase subunit alpha